MDWERILTRGSTQEIVTHLTARGKNELFLARVADILGLDTLGRPSEWLDIKRAVTPSAVRDIHEAVATIWPTGEDLKRTLTAERSQDNALYIGMYIPELVARGVARHATYSDTILVVDPFPHPGAVAPDFNPVLNPHQHRINTLICLRLWFSLAPWLQAGIVRIVRSPGDFDGELWRRAMAATEQRYGSAELKAVHELATDEAIENVRDYKDVLMLATPDEEIEQIARRRHPDASDSTITQVLETFRQWRDEHPFYLEPPPGVGRHRELMTISSGTNYETAKVIAATTGAHVVTDMRDRWKEIEIDRGAAGTDAHVWSAFAKAFSHAKVRFLDATDLAMATRIRDDARLADLRSFFRKVWRDIGAGESFDEAYAGELAAELHDRLREAEAAWQKIDQDLLRWVGGEAAIAGGLIASGAADLVPALVTMATAGVANIVHSAVQRRTFKKEYPAAFFLHKA